MVLCIIWITWPKTNVWNKIMNGETEAVRARIEAGFDVNSICPGVDTLTLGEKWKYLSEFEWPPKEYNPDSWGKWNAMSIAVMENHPGMVQLLVENGAAWPSAHSIIGLGEKNLAKRYIQQGGKLELDDIDRTQRAGLVGWLIEQELELGIDKNILLHWATLPCTPQRSDHMSTKKKKKARKPGSHYSATHRQRCRCEGQKHLRRNACRLGVRS